MKKILIGVTLILLLISAGYSQKTAKNKSAIKIKSIVFAVLNDGQTLEPIGEIDKGEMVETVNGGGEPNALTNFANNYYSPNKTYNLIFGGAVNGTVTIKSSNTKSECGKNLADITILSAKAKLKGFVMGLATNAKPANAGTGLRRLPTAAERTEIESLIRSEFIKQGVSKNAVKVLKSYNLTALDVDNDGKVEFVGSYRVDSSAKEKNMLFFIAEIGTDEKYKFGFSNYEKITPDKVMSGNLKDLDDLGGELLLDTLEYNGDKTAEIFTINTAFEGNNFNVYSRRDGKWSKVFTSYNYHCAY